MIQVKDGKILQTALPTTGVLADGRTVSNYHCLSQDILIAEGWLPEEEVKPEYDLATEQLIGPTYDIQINKVIVTYTKETIPTPDPIIQNIILSKDKETIINNGIDTVTVTATFEGEQVNTFTCYVTVNGPPAEAVTIVNGEVIREFTSETPGLFKVEFYAGTAYIATFIEVTEVTGS